MLRRNYGQNVSSGFYTMYSMGDSEEQHIEAEYKLLRLMEAVSRKIFPYSVSLSKENMIPRLGYRPISHKNQHGFNTTTIWILNV